MIFKYGWQTIHFLSGSYEMKNICPLNNHFGGTIYVHDLAINHIIKMEERQGQL